MPHASILECATRWSSFRVTCSVDAISINNNNNIRLLEYDKLHIHSI